MDKTMPFGEWWVTPATMLPQAKPVMCATSQQSARAIMTPAEFRAWRKQLCLTQREAAAALGVSLSQVSDYESGMKRGTDRPAIIPRTVVLACRAISGGLSNEDT